MRNYTNKVVKESITNSLLTLMKERTLDKITIVEITSKAGVGRVSFYRNFNSKEEIILNYMKDITFNKWEEYQKNPKQNICLWYFKMIYEMKDFLPIIYNANCSNLLLDHIRMCCGPKDDQSNNQAYKNSVLSCALFGFADEWIKRGMRETPEQMAEIMKNIKLL